MYSIRAGGTLLRVAYVLIVTRRGSTPAPTVFCRGHASFCQDKLVSTVLNNILPARAPSDCWAPSCRRRPQPNLWNLRGQLRGWTLLNVTYRVDYIRLG